jgi:hypothetical protein
MFIIQKFKVYIDSLHSLLFINHYCEDIDQVNCTGRYLAIKQIANSFVTLNTPPVSSIVPTDTIC